MVKDSHNNQTFRPIVGIDLGTTNSAIAFVRQGKPEIIPSLDAERIIPSVVLIDMQRKVIVGENARASLVAMPERTVAAIKRQMGSAERVLIAGEALLPEEISALILKELKRYVDVALGEGDKEAVITVPAYFTDDQRRATKRAGELAGFVVERIINEPTAAALAYGLNHLGDDQHIFVYDLGGGTFDVSVCELMSGIVEVKASKGNRQLGGEDFDWRLVDWFAQQIENDHGVDPRTDLRARALLKEEAERVKKQLSFEAEVTVSLPIVTVIDNQPIGLYLTVTRAQFESLIDDLLQETMAIVRDVLIDAGLQASDMDEVLLVGGSTRIPRVQALLHGFFGKPARIDVDPDEAVALGAAVQAGLKAGTLNDSGLIVTDVAPFSMGIAVLQSGQLGMPRAGGFSIIIPRNTTIPVTKTERYMTVYPGQTAVSIEIYQGEHEWVKHNHRLGEFLLEGIPENEEEEEPILVEFRYNLNGILEVSAKAASNGKAMSITVQDALQRDSEAVYEESVARLVSLWENADDEEDWDAELEGEEDLNWDDELEAEDLLDAEDFPWDTDDEEDGNGAKKG
jgi:molecular chaperone DnaK